MGPLEATKPWSMEGVNGVRGFLDRVWRMIVDERSETLELNPAVQDVEPTVEQDRVLHRTIQAVTQDIERLSFNTAIAKMMEFTNFFTKCDVAARAWRWRSWCCCCPRSPRTWPKSCGNLLGTTRRLAYEPWPTFDPRCSRATRSKFRCRSTASCGARSSCRPGRRRGQHEQAARADPRIAELLAGKTVVKVIVVPGRLVNFVIK